MFTTIWTSIRRRARPALRVVHRRLLAWTRPAAGLCIGSTAGDLTRTRAALIAENAFLRQQLAVLARQVKRPVRTPADRLRLVLLARLARGWRAAPLIVQPATLLRWQRQGFRLLWGAKSRAASTRPQVSAEAVATIQRLATENRLWGAERIRGGAAQARHPGGQAHGPAPHARRTSAATCRRRADLGDLPAEPRA
jgi:putative transposase